MPSGLRSPALRAAVQAPEALLWLAVRGRLDWPRRHALMRHHCLLHVVNALAHQRFGGLVSGAEIGPERSRVDLSVTAFSRDDLPAFEAAVNEVIRRALRVRA